MNIDQLSPEQKDALLRSLLGAAGDESAPIAGMGMGHTDEADDRKLIQEYMELLAGGMEILASKIQSLETAVYEDLVGGLSSVLSARTRAAILQEAQTKYPQFGEFGDFVKEIDGGDLWEEFADILEEIRGEPDYDESAEGERIQGLYEAMKSKMGRLRGVPADGVAIEVSTGVPEEMVESAPAPVPVRGQPDVESIKRTAARLKAANITSV